MWIPKEEFGSVNKLNKITDHDDWKTTITTVGRFADHKNSRVLNS